MDSGGPWLSPCPLLVAIGSDTMGGNAKGLGSTGGRKRDQRERSVQGLTSLLLIPFLGS